MSWKSGTILNISKTKGGRTRLCFKYKDTAKAKAEGKTPYFFLVLLPDHTGTYLKGDTFKGDGFKKGESILDGKGVGVDTYFEEYTEMKGTAHQDLNDGEKPIDKVVEMKDVPEFKTDSDLVAIKMVELALQMSELTNYGKYDECMDYIKDEIRKLMK